jgi:hypothetical protein
MPVKDGEFIAWAKTIFRDCKDNAEEWEIVSETIAQFSDWVDSDASTLVISDHHS